MDKQTVKRAPKPYLSGFDVWAMAFGCMVGWGAFVMPGTTFLPIAGPIGTIAAMAVSTLIMLIIGYNFAFLMNHSPGPGGVYSYTKEAFGRDHAFLSSWFLCLSYLTIVFLNGTALFVVLRTMLGDSIHTGYYYTVSDNKIYFGEILVSVSALAGVGVLFLTAKKVLHKIHSFLAVIMIAGIFLLAAICIPHAVSSRGLGLTVPGTNTAYGIYSIIFLAPWAFVGFDVISFDTYNFNFRITRSKGIIFSGIIVAGLAYTAMAIVSIASVPDGYSDWTQYFANLGSLSDVRAVPTFYAAKSIMGEPGLIIIGITALSAVLTGIIGGYRATIRVLSTMAEDKILSEFFSKTVHSTLFIMIFSISLALFGRNTLSWFVDLTSFGAIVAFGYTSAAAYKLAKAEGLRPVKVSGLAGTVISAIFVVVQLVPRLTAMEAMGSEAFLLLSFWCLIGFVFYWRTTTRSTLTEYSGFATSGVTLFALLIYSALLWFGKLLDSKKSIPEVHSSIITGGIILLVIIFTGLVIMLYIQNLVRRKHEAAEIERIRATERNNAKSRFMFNMSHDIRTPMNAIVGYTGLALKEEASPRLHDYLVKIDRSNKHLMTLINDILEMSRIESGKTEIECMPADLCRIFGDIREMFEEQMKQKKLDFTVDTSGLINRYIWCDEKNLTRVILNLLSNSYKFTPEGGRISVSVTEEECDENSYSTYVIGVSDTGIGMSEEFVGKMFSPFERERTSTVSGIEGTGLGLSITKSLTDLMGGTIDVETAAGKGTKMVLSFKFRLAEESEISKEEQSSTAHEEIGFSGRKILLAEDNDINMEIVNMILTQAGFTVDTAENGSIAVDMLAASEPGEYDAVLMDVQMPVMDGYTATRKIRELENKELAGIPIIAMTANAFREDAEEALAAGMQAHIAKPIDVDVLFDTLRRVLAESREEQ